MNATRREKLGNIYKNFFEPNSKNCIDYDFFDALCDSGIIDIDTADRLTATFDTLGSDLYETLLIEDKRRLNELNKQQ